MMGAGQEQWIAKTMSTSPAQRNTVVNQVISQRASRKRLIRERGA
jgi:phosphodiesterase/alkaline phosphatase D-like protein